MITTLIILLGIIFGFTILPFVLKPGKDLIVIMRKLTIEIILLISLSIICYNIFIPFTIISIILAILYAKLLYDYNELYKEIKYMILEIIHHYKEIYPNNWENKLKEDKDFSSLFDYIPLKRINYEEAS